MLIKKSLVYDSYEQWQIIFLNLLAESIKECDFFYEMRYV